MASALFVAVDRAVFTAALAQRLRQAGVNVPLAAVERGARALEAVQRLDRDHLYWLCRISFVSRFDHVETFDRVFDQIFGTPIGRHPAGRRGQTSSGAGEEWHAVRRSSDAAAEGAAGLPWATRPQAGSSKGDDPMLDEVLAIPELRPSPQRSEVDRPFAELDEDELERIAASLERLMPAWPQRQTRRRRPSGSAGTVALRRSARSALRTGGEVIRLDHDRPGRRPRPVVAIVDVSGSMETYARAYLHLMRALAVAHRAEVFVFASEVTRITPQLRLRSPEQAIAASTTAVGDRFGGTRIATAVRTLIRDPKWANMLRGAVVLVISDGWDTDPPEQLEQAMARLARLTHRIVWVNPRSAGNAYQPLAAGMAAALAHCDHFLPGHTLAAMSDVVDVVAGDARHRRLATR